MLGRCISRVQLCGQFAVVAGDERIDTLLPGRRGRLLLAYLAAHRRRPVARDELVEALWSESAGAGTAATLTVLLSKVRSLLGHDVIQGRGTLRLVLPEDAIVDAEQAVVALHRAESAVAQGEWRRAWAAKTST